MSDTPQTPWRDQLSPGHVVAYAFPLAEPVSGRGIRPKRRPCLVVEIDRHRPEPTVTLAYGTGASTGANIGLELHVTDEAARIAAGVRRPTRFVGARRVTVPLDDEGFDLNMRGTPILGRLNAVGAEKLDVIRRLLAAEPHRAQAPREGRRRRRGGRRRHRTRQGDAAAT